MRKIKLLIFTKSIDGGTGTFCENLEKLNKAFSYTKIESHFAVLERPNFRFNHINSYRYFRKENFYSTRFCFSIDNIKSFLEDLIWFKKMIDKFNPIVILSVDVHCNLITILLKLFFFKKIRVILTTHINLEENIDQRTDFFLKIFLKKSVSFFYNKADSLVFVSKDLANSCIKNFHLNQRLVKTIFNGIKSKKKESYLKKQNKKKKIINVSRLVEQKNHSILIKAFYILQKKYPNCELLLLSDGHLKKDLQRLTKQLKIGSKVKFLGWVKNVYKYLRKADVFVFSSKREGFGYVIVEAMSQGLPVISTDTPYGPREILGNGKYGVLVSMKDPKAMADAMYELLTDKEKYQYYAKKSLERVKFFSEEKMLKAYKKLILDVLNEK